MQPGRTMLAAVITVVVLAVGGASYAQESAGEKHSEVFCSAKKTAQLCNHGTADLLKLSGSKRERWTNITNSYNLRESRRRRKTC